MAVRDIDRGSALLIRRLEELGGGVRVTVGIHDEDGAAPHPTSSATIVEVGALAEFGTDRQPPRSFIRAPFDQNAGRTERRLVEAAVAVARGREVKGSFAAVGLELLDSMLDSFDRQAPLDEDTVEAKGSTQPLEDTGTLRESLRVRVNGVEVSS